MLRGRFVARAVIVCLYDRLTVLVQEEAFRLWKEWSEFYAPTSAERKLLERMRRELWLVSIVHHDFKDPDGLWKFWLEGRPMQNGS